MGKKVLVVDTDERIQDIIAELLEMEGFVPLSASTAVDGLVLIKNERPSLVIADVKMSEMYGMEFCRQVRHEAPDIAIIMLTAAGIPSMTSEDNNIIDALVLKPFDVNDLIVHVNKLLQEKSSDNSDDLVASSI